MSWCLTDLLINCYNIFINWFFVSYDWSLSQRLKGAFMNMYNYMQRIVVNVHCACMYICQICLVSINLQEQMKQKA